MATECSLLLGCTRPHSAKGLCAAHYNQRRRGRLLTPIRDIYARDAEGRKQCCICKEWKPVEEFYVHRRSGDGLLSNCRWCSAMRTISRKYRISPQRYREMRDAQRGRCAACGCRPAPNRVGVTLLVDHDHRCCPAPPTCGSCSRGLVCWSCNIALGAAGDDVERLKTLIVYLEDYS